MVDYYAIMGNPVAHSKSPFIHAEFAKQTQQSIRYIKIEVPIGQFQQQVNTFRADNGKGLNITLPFKQEAYQLASTLTSRALIAKAVNTLSFLDNGDLLGDNTDGIGFIRDITINQHYSLKNKHILILGAGGAVHGILHPLCKQHPKRIMIANRTWETAQKLTTEFGQYGLLAATPLENIVGHYDIIINSINRGLTEKDFDLNPNILDENTFCYDLIYGQKPTPFLKWAYNHGARKTADGTGMLVEQAAESFFIWRGIQPNTSKVIDMLMQQKEK